jgi:CBS domain containing-hemolysin-like protein
VPELLLIVLALALVAACGAFVAAEFAFITVDRSSVERAAEAGNARAGGVLAALRTLSTQLSGAQLGITVTNLVIGFLAEPAIAQLIRGPLEDAGVPGRAVPGIAVTLALLVATAVTMIYGELIPKNLAIASPLATASAVQGFQRGFTKVTAWPISFFNGSANALLRRMGVEPQEELASARSAEELSSLVERSAEQGTLARDTAQLLQRTLSFGDKQASDVLTPRTRMQSVPGDAPVSEVIALTQRTGHSRFPVTGESADDILGLVHLKHAVTVPEDEREQVLVRDVLVPAIMVPSTMRLDPLLEALRGGLLHMAVVVDEFEGVDGIVTVEDLVEELVGEVVDEHDRLSARAQRQPDGSWILSGLLRPDEVLLLTGIELPEHRSYETLGGLVTARLGRIPAVGDDVWVDGTHITVTHTARRRVERLRVEAPVGATAADHVDDLGDPGEAASR